MEYEIVKLTDRPQLKEISAHWFNEKWNVPLEAYLDSMDDCLKTDSSVPQWYVVLDGDKIVGGMGVIDNDFHERKDLTPNVCAVYVENVYRGKRIAAHLLDFVCKDMKDKGIDTLYLVTSHTSLYERYGWEYFCDVRCDGEEALSRIYVHHQI